MMAPSGKFWIAIPMVRAKAPAAVMGALPVRRPANTTPTAMPSGRLCSVTANTSMVVFFKLLFGPSGVSLPM